MSPFDMRRKPSMQYPFLMPLVWGGSFLLTRQFGLKIDKSAMRGIKPPYLLISTHQGFTDYYIGPLAMFPHRAVYVSDMEGFAAFGKWLYRGLGCIGKRRYVPDLSVIMNIKYALKKGQSVVIYPESRHSNVGTTSYIPANLGRLAKLLAVPVVTISAKGCYLANPFWNEEKTRRVPITAKMECIYDKAALEEAKPADIQAKIEEKLTYDEYAYQHEAGFLIKDQDRAEGLELALYQCKACRQMYGMRTKGAVLWCESCQAKWTLSEDGWLVSKDSNKQQQKLHIPDWYEWQRKNVTDELNYHKEFSKRYEVRIEALPNEKGFVKLGKGELIFNQKEFILSFIQKDGAREQLIFPHANRESVQTEYNYRQRGACIVLSTKDCCYYTYSASSEFNPTQLQFAGEFFYGKEHKIVDKEHRIVEKNITL